MLLNASVNKHQWGDLIVIILLNPWDICRDMNTLVLKYQKSQLQTIVALYN